MKLKYYIENSDMTLDEYMTEAVSSGKVRSVAAQLKSLTYDISLEEFTELLDNLGFESKEFSNLNQDISDIDHKLYVIKETKFYNSNKQLFVKNPDKEDVASDMVVYFDKSDKRINRILIGKHIASFNTNVLEYKDTNIKRLISYLMS